MDSCLRRSLRNYVAALESKTAGTHGSTREVKPSVGIMLDEQDPDDPSVGLTFYFPEVVWAPDSKAAKDWLTRLQKGISDTLRKLPKQG